MVGAGRIDVRPAAGDRDRILIDLQEAGDAASGRLDQLRELETTMRLDYLLVSPLSEKTFDLFTERVLPEFV